MNEPEKTVSPEAAARLQRMFENIYSQTPYFQSMPCTVEKLDVGRVRVGFDISRHSCNYRGIASGGVLAAFCDTLMGMASRTLGFQVTTLEINMNYIRSVKGGTLPASARSSTTAGRRLSSNVSATMPAGILL